MKYVSLRPCIVFEVNIKKITIYIFFEMYCLCIKTKHRLFTGNQDLFLIREKCEWTITGVAEHFFKINLYGSLKGTSEAIPLGAEPRDKMYIHVL